MYLTLYNVYSNIVRHYWSWFQHVLEWFNHQIWTNPLRTNIEPQIIVEDDHPRNFPVLAFTGFFCTPHSQVWELYYSNPPTKCGKSSMKLQKWW